MKPIQYFLIAVLFVISGCKKDNVNKNPLPNLVLAIEQDSAFVKWGQAANGRWVPYSMEQTDQQRPNKENLFQAMNVSVTPVLIARKYYEAVLFEKYGNGMAHFNRFLDSLYKRNYSHINATLSKRAVMDELYNSYRQLIPQETISINEDLPEVVIIACQIPQDVVNFFNIYINWQLIPVIPPASTQQAQDCHAYNLGLVDNYIRMMRYEYNQGGFNCGYWLELTYQAMQAYYTCDPLNIESEESPQDPYGPGGGGTNNGDFSADEDSPEEINSMVVQSPGHPVDIAAELDCFGSDPNASYKVSINVNQPDPATRGLMNSSVLRKVGHTYLTLKQINPDGSIIVRNIGYYPANAAWPGNEVDAAAFADDSNTPYAVSLSMGVTASEFQAIKTYLKNAVNTNYNLVIHNCTTVAVLALSACAISVPLTTSNNVFFTGHNPGDLGEDIREMNESFFSYINMNREVEIYRANDNIAYPPVRSGNCP